MVVALNGKRATMKVQTELEPQANFLSILPSQWGSNSATTLTSPSLYFPSLRVKLGA